MSAVSGGASTWKDPEAEYFAGSGRREPSPPPEPEPPDNKAERLAAAEEAASERSATASPDTAVAPCPLKQRHTIEVLVVDSGTSPVENVALVLEKSETEVLVAKTDADGVARFRGLLQEAYRLYPRDLDRDTFELDKTEALPSERDLCTGDAAWKGPVASDEQRPLTHVVEEGECVSTLAHRYGLLPDTIWDVEDNAALKKLREHKNVLNPDDKVVIPAIRRGANDVEAGKAYRIHRKGFGETIHIRFLDSEGKPRVKVPYLIALAGDEGTEERAGETNGEGFVVEPAATTIHTVKITLGKGSAKQKYEFRAARLDPLDTISGAQARLCHLGYTCSDEDGVIGRWTRRALRDFQKDYDLPVTSDLDDATRKKLRSEYLV